MSSLVKLYVQEPGSDTMRSLFLRPDTPGTFFASDHVCLEVLVTLGRNLHRGGKKRRRSYRSAVEKFADDRQEHLNVVTVESRMVADAMSLAVDYADSGAGTLDLVHLAAAAHVRKVLPSEPLIFVVADRKLRFLAERAGFLVFNPEKDDVDALPAPGLGL